MAYAAVTSLANTIDRTLNNNLYSISLEEKQLLKSLLEYVTPFEAFLDEFLDKFKSLEGRMREVANEAEDILESLVLEKVFVSCDDESASESHPNPNLKKVIEEEIYSKMGKVIEEFRHDFPDEAKASFRGRLWDAYEFYEWQKTHTRFRDRMRFLPPKYAKFKSKNHLNKLSDEVDSITEEVMAIKKNNSAIKDNDKDDTSSSTFAPVDNDDGGGGDDDGNDELKCHRIAKHELQLKKVMEEIALIAAQVKEIKESSSSKGIFQRSTDSSALSSSSPAPTKPVGFDHYVEDLKERLCGEPSRKLQVLSICGMGGSGKTTLARNVYEDPLIMEHFDIRVWVTISQDYSAERIFSSLLESLKEFKASVSGESDDEKVYKILIGRKYLVVLDDVWSSEAWDAVKKVFPRDDGEHGSRILLTTRLSEVASYPGPWSKLYEIGLLNADQSWNLFKQKVFRDEDCPSELESIGKEIAGNCKGLPLAIVVIAGLVSTVSKNPNSWKEIAENVKSAETAEHNQIEEILSLSYYQLPQYLRPCFLYMGSFPEDDEISVTRLIRLWIAEGFVKSHIDYEKVGEELFEELVKRNLVLVTKRRSDGRIKSCSLHDLVRDLCIRKAHESKFFLNVMDNKHIEKEHFIESIQNQRRLSVDSSYLRYLSNYDGSTIHSIKCSKYDSVELDFVKGVRLVRVLDAEAADAESLPDQLFELLHLRYLAIRNHQQVPRALSNLQNLQTLIIHREEQTKFGVGVACGMLVPWCMPQLRHVYFHGEICFDDPRDTTPPLENLQTLSSIGSACCTESILKKIPNLKKLKIDCSGPGSEDAGCLDDLVHLERLENLEVYAGRWVESRPEHYNFTFPKILKKLILRDLEVAWNDMIVVGSLPKLKVLKLKGCTCVGGTWETTEGAFPVLEVLLIEAASGFENWITESSHFQRLKRLLLHSCWDLNEIPTDVGEFPSLELIEVKGDAKKSLVESAEVIRREQEDLGNDTLQVLCIANSSRL